MKFLDEIKGKVDKKAFYITIGLLLMSWAAFPLIYYLLVKRYKTKEKEVKEDEDMGQIR